jgi:hypothetical protein
VEQQQGLQNNLSALYKQYTPTGAEIGVTLEALVQFSSECKLIDKKLSENDVRMIFQSVKLGKKTTLSFDRFEEACRKIAIHKEVAYQELFHHAVRVRDVTQPGDLLWDDFPPFEEDDTEAGKPVPPPKPPAFTLVHENDAGHTSVLSPMQSPVNPAPLHPPPTADMMQTREEEIAKVTDELMGIVNSKSKWVSELESILAEVAELNPTAGGDLHELSFTQLLVRLEAMTSKLPRGQRMRDYNGRASSGEEQEKFLTSLRTFYAKHDPTGEKYPSKPELTAPLHEVLDFCRRTWGEEPTLEYCRSFSMNYLVNFVPLEESQRKGKTAMAKRREHYNENLKSGVSVFKNLPIKAELSFNLHGCSSRYVVGSGKSGHLEDKETSLLPNLYDYSARIKMYLPDMLQVGGSAAQTNVLDNIGLLGLQKTVDQLCDAGVIQPLHEYVELSRLVKQLNSLAAKYDRDAGEHTDNARSIVDSLASGAGMDGEDSPAGDLKYRSRTVVAMDYGSGMYEHTGKDRQEKQEDKAHTFCTKALTTSGRRCDELRVVWFAFLRFARDFKMNDHDQWERSTGDDVAWGLRSLQPVVVRSKSVRRCAPAGAAGAYKDGGDDRGRGATTGTRGSAVGERGKQLNQGKEGQSYVDVMESLAHTERVMEQYCNWLVCWLVDARHGAGFLRSHTDERARKEVSKFCAVQLAMARSRRDEEKFELQTQCTEGKVKREGGITKTFDAMEQLLGKHSAAAAENGGGAGAGGAGGRGGEVDVVATAGAYYRVRKGELQDSMRNVQQKLRELQKQYEIQAAAVRKCEEEEATRARDERHLALSATGTRMKAVGMRALILQIRVSYVTVQAAMYR